MNGVAHLNDIQPFIVVVMQTVKEHPLLHGRKFIEIFKIFCRHKPLTRDSKVINCFCALAQTGQKLVEFLLAQSSSGKVGRRDAFRWTDLSLGDKRTYAVKKISRHALHRISAVEIFAVGPTDLQATISHKPDDFQNVASLAPGMTRLSGKVGQQPES
jgi:hypothetical protein